MCQQGHGGGKANLLNVLILLLQEVKGTSCVDTDDPLPCACHVETVHCGSSHYVRESC